MIFQPLRRLLHIAWVRGFFPGDDDQDQRVERRPLSGARPQDRWDNRREDTRAPPRDRARSPPASGWR